MDPGGYLLHDTYLKHNNAMETIICPVDFYNGFSISVNSRCSVYINHS
jgi:hypothetical protein